jgi:hypothetical protein
MPRRGYDDVLMKDPTKMSAEEKIGRTKQKLGESDRRSLRSQIEQREEEIRSKKELNPDADVSEMKREIDHKKMILQHDDDLVPKSGSERDRLAKRAKDIEDILKREMPTKREMWPKPGSTESQQAVRHNLKFQDQRDGLCKEWQEIQKKLNPEDPYAQSLELIRPD